MKPIIDLSTIEEYASKNVDEFESFLLRVKKLKVTEFDQIAAPVVEEVTKSIDCTQCGNCCKIQEPGVTKEEIQSLASIKQLEVDEFATKYVASDKDGVNFLCNKPCIFLSDTTCTIYPQRPFSCADFPGLSRPGLKWRMKQVAYNYRICPIVFNVVEQLKGVI